MTTNLTTNSLESQVINNVFHIFPILRNRILKSREIAQETDIQLPHAQILLELSEHDNMSVTQLSRHTGIAMPNITPIIDRLCSLGYVDRHHSSNDRRMVEISIKDAGLDCIRRIKAVIADQTFHQDVYYSEAQLVRLNEALQTIMRYFQIED